MNNHISIGLHAPERQQVPLFDVGTPHVHGHLGWSLDLLTNFSDFHKHTSVSRITRLETKYLLEFLPPKTYSCASLIWTARESSRMDTSSMGFDMLTWMIDHRSVSESYISIDLLMKLNQFSPPSFMIQRSLKVQTVGFLNPMLASAISIHFLSLMLYLNPRVEHFYLSLQPPTTYRNLLQQTNALSRMGEGIGPRLLTLVWLTSISYREGSSLSLVVRQLIAQIEPYGVESDLTYSPNSQEVGKVCSRMYSLVTDNSLDMSARQQQNMVLVPGFRWQSIIFQ